MFEWPKIKNLGEGPTRSLFGQHVVIEEKIDGSNIAVMFDSDCGIKANSRRGMIKLDNPPSSCRVGVNYLKNISNLLNPDVTYFFECRDDIDSHHTSYQRVPANGLVLLDIVSNNGEWYSSENKRMVAEILNCEYSFMSELKPPWSLHELAEFMEHDSMLGNNMEGVVVKNINESEHIMAKLVRYEYRESFIPNWSGRDDLSSIAASTSVAVATEIRFDKVAQKMSDNYELKNDRADIGKLVMAIWDDVIEEESDKFQELSSKQIKDVRNDINRRATIWYKAKLAGWDKL